MVYLVGLLCALGVAAPAPAQDLPEIGGPPPRAPKDPPPPTPTPGKPPAPAPPPKAGPIPPSEAPPSEAPAPSPTPVPPTEGAAEGDAPPAEGPMVEVLILEAGSRTPLGQARVLVTSSGQMAATDMNGRVRLRDLGPGAYILQIEALSGAQTVIALPIDAAGQAPRAIYVRMDEVDDGTMIISESKPDSPVAERVLKADEIRMIPGSLGDAVRAVQNLPGVSWAPLSLGLLIIRGTNPEDSGYFIDGIRIPQVFHFLGVTTIVNSDLLDSVRFLPGGFGVRYGRVLGGVIDLETKPDPGERHHGYGAVDLFHSSAFAQGPIGEKSGYVFSIRRSYIDAVLNPVLNNIELDYFIQAPRYWDYQVGFYHRLNDRHRFRILVMGSQDNFAVFGEAPEDADPNQVEEALLDYQTGLTQVQLKWDAFLGEGIVSETVVALGPQPNQASFGSGSITIDPFYFQLRQELRGELVPKAVFRVGLDLEISHEQLRFEVGEGQSADVLEGDIWSVAPAPYLELSIQPFEGLNIVPGVRVDPLFLVGQPNMLAVDPRIAARYAPLDRLRLKGAVGLFSGFPTALEFMEEFGTPELRPESGLQSSWGFETDLPLGLTVDALGYFNWYTSLVVQNSLESPSPFEIATGGVDPEDLSGAPIYVNEGEGKAYGLELMVRRSYGERAWGWASYTLQRSVRRADPEDEWVLYDYDQTHLLTLVGVLNLPREWSLGGRFRYGTGGIYTPVVGRTYIVDSGSYAPLYGETNSVRYPARHSLDVRVERTFIYDKWSLGVYLDLQNAYNHANVESHYFSWDYQSTYYIAGLPIFPALGVRGRW